MKQVAMVGIVLAACSRFEPPAPTSVVTLREPGAEPRRALSYHPRASVPVPRFTLDEPDLTLTLSWQPDGKATPPGLRYRFSITDAKFPGAGSDMEAMFLTLEPGLVVSDDHGRASAGVPGPHWTLPSVPGLLGVFIVPLPVDATGVGARWHINGPFVGDPRQSVASDYELTALTADEATVTWDSMYMSSSEPRTAGTVHGTATIRFDDLLPIDGHVTQVFTVPDFGPISPSHITLAR